MKLTRSFREIADRKRWLRSVPDSIELPSFGSKPRLLVDVSNIIRHDAQTGIQRVVRSVWAELLRRDGHEFHIVPVYASAKNGYCEAPLDFLSADPCSLNAEPVRVRPGDKFLGLDLSAHLLPKYVAQLRMWRRSGVSVHLVVYDLLPLKHPNWFNRSTPRHFRRWFDVLCREADQAICISDDVAADLRNILTGRKAEKQLAIGRLPMAADIAQSMPSTGICNEVLTVLARMRFRSAILMVGTVEPRKGYDVALSAFDFLWRTSPASAPDLIIVGKRGWKTAALQLSIKAHPLFGKRLFWLDEVSDEGLCACYEAARGLLVTSKAEGFGLPLIEAAGHCLPVLARDLPVFREQGLENVTYFKDDQPQSLGREILKLSEAPRMTAPPRLRSWRRAVDVLLSELGFAKAEPLAFGTSNRDAL